MSRPRWELIVEIDRRLEPDHTPVRGNFMATGDDEADRADEDEVIRQLEAGNEAAWCGAIVEVAIGLSDDGEMPPRGGAWAWTGHDSIWGMSYPSERELWANDPQHNDVAGNAMREALEKVLNVVHGPVDDETSESGYGRQFRKNLAHALQRWLAQNPEWAVFADQWLEEHQ